MVRAELGGYAHLYASLPRCVPCSTLGTTAEDCTSLFFLFVFQIWFVLYLSSQINTQYWASKWTAAQNNRAPLVCLYKGDAAEHCCAGLHIVRYIRPRTVGGVMQRLRFPFAACHFLFTDIRFYSGPQFLLSSCISKTKCTHRCEQGS